MPATTHTHVTTHVQTPTSVMLMGTLPTGVLPQHPECPKDRKPMGGTPNPGTWAMRGCGWEGSRQPQHWVSPGCPEGLTGLAERGEGCVWEWWGLGRLYRGKKHRGTVEASCPGEARVLARCLRLGVLGIGQGPTGEATGTVGGQRAQEFPVRSCPAQSEAGLSAGRDGGKVARTAPGRSPQLPGARPSPFPPAQVPTPLSEELPYTGEGWGRGPPPGSTAGPPPLPRPWPPNSHPDVLSWP